MQRLQRRIVLITAQEEDYVDYRELLTKPLNGPMEEEDTGFGVVQIRLLSCTNDPEWGNDSIAYIMMSILRSLW